MHKSLVPGNVCSVKDKRTSSTWGSTEKVPKAMLWLGVRPPKRRPRATGYSFYTGQGIPEAWHKQRRGNGTRGVRACEQGRCLGWRAEVWAWDPHSPGAGSGHMGCCLPAGLGYVPQPRPHTLFLWFQWCALIVWKMLIPPLSWPQQRGHFGCPSADLGQGRHAERTSGGLDSVPWRGGAKASWPRHFISFSPELTSESLLGSPYKVKAELSLQRQLWEGRSFC